MRRIELTAFGPSGDHDAATVLDAIGTVVATVAEPIVSPETDLLRDAVVAAALDEDFGETILAGVVFAPQWGGDAIGFT